MSIQVNILEAKNRLSELIRAAQSGEEVMIANRGEPVARLVPANSADSVRRTGQGPAFVQWLRDHPLPRHLQRTHEEIEKGIAAERRGWD